MYTAVLFETDFIGITMEYLNDTHKKPTPRRLVLLLPSLRYPSLPEYIASVTTDVITDAMFGMAE